MPETEEKIWPDDDSGAETEKFPMKSALMRQLEKLQHERAKSIMEALMAHEEIEKLSLRLLEPPAFIGIGGAKMDKEELQRALTSLKAGIATPRAVSVDVSRQPSALDTWASIQPGDFDWRDATTEVALSSYGLRGEKEGPFPNMSRTVTFIELGANGIASSHVTSIGAEVARIGGMLMESIYVRFKGGKLYRYTSLDGEARYAALLLIASNMSKALPCELTVGEYIERVLKAGHENGLINCEGLDDDNVWRPALKPSEAAQRRKEASERRKRERSGPPDEPGVPSL